MCKQRELRQRIKKTETFKFQSFSGAPLGTRTPNLLIRSQTLYPIELMAHKPCCGLCAFRRPVTASVLYMIDVARVKVF